MTEPSPSGGGSAASGPSAEPDAIDELETRNNVAASSALERGEVPLHAAAVEVDERVIAIAGPSRAGKSTLAAAAVLAGWGYVADEIAAVHPATLAVRPYHRPIGLRPGGAAQLGVALASPALDGVSQPWPVEEARWSHGGRLAAIVVVARDSEPGVTPLAPPAALAALAQHTVVADDTSVPDAFGDLGRLVRSVPVVTLGYATPGDGVALLHRVLAEVALP